MSRAMESLSSWDFDLLKSKIENGKSQPRYFRRDNSTYEARAMFQLALWQKGVPIHNDIDNECCPDFSCCRGYQHMVSQLRRDMFVTDKASRASMIHDWIEAMPAHERVLYDLPGQVVMELRPGRKQ